MLFGSLFLLSCLWAERRVKLDGGADEPTSGLDARAAQIVMRVVRNIVNNNRTIVCTIHQPSTEIFLNFDELLLLKRGGWTIYYGELGDHSRNLVDYFENVDGAKTLQQGYNPATYMLEVRLVQVLWRAEFGLLAFCLICCKAVQSAWSTCSKRLEWHKCLVHCCA